MKTRDTETLVHHCRVYALAEKYDIQSLKSIASKKFKLECETHWDCIGFIDAIREVYSNTPDHDRGLRDVVVETIRAHQELLDMGQVKSVLKETLLAFDIVMASRQYPQDFPFIFDWYPSSDVVVCEVGITFWHVWYKADCILPDDLEFNWVYLRISYGFNTTIGTSQKSYINYRLLFDTYYENCLLIISKHHGTLYNGIYQMSRLPLQIVPWSNKQYQRLFTPVITPSSAEDGP